MAENKSNRGLRMASKETRERVARMGGEASGKKRSKNNMNHQI